MLVQSDAQPRVDGWWQRHRPSLDHVLVAIAMLGILIALVVALWPGD